MTKRELLDLLTEYPDDYDVLTADYESVLHIERVEEWKHFQTNQPMGGILLLPGGAA